MGILSSKMESCSHESSLIILYVIIVIVKKIHEVGEKKIVESILRKNVYAPNNISPLLVFERTLFTHNIIWRQ
jgi:hypothetical protein